MYSHNPSLRTKYIFLSLMQQYFSEHAKYKWDVNPSKTNIIIADKYSVEMGVAAKRPSIIMDRGPFQWRNAYRNEALPRNEKPFRADAGWQMVPRLTGNRDLNYKLTDLLSGSLTFNVVAKDPFVADYLANEVFYVLTGFREWYKEKGVHKVENISVGRENMVRVDSVEVELTLLPVSLRYTRQETVVIGERAFNARVYIDDEEIGENIDFVFEPDGTQIELSFPLESGKTLTMDYVDAVTLDTVEGAELVSVGGSDTIFTVPDNGTVFGYYKIVEDIILNEPTII